jgi:uncharacterized membrane protein
MRRYLCGLMAVGLFLVMAGQGHGQPTYAFTQVDVPSSLFPSNTNATGINNSGQIAGGYQGGGSPPQGFLLDQGSYTPLGVPGFTGDTIASGINDSGQIVGSYGFFGDGLVYGFLLDQGTYTTLDVPGSTYTSATGIDDSGQIVEWCAEGFGVHGFLATPTP